MTPKEAFRQRLVETRVRFKRLSTEDLEAYLASGEWRGKAGGYAVQGLAGTFVVKMVGSYTNVVGLPLYETHVAARRRGLSGAFRLAERGVTRCSRHEAIDLGMDDRRFELGMPGRMNIAAWLTRGLSHPGFRRSAMGRA